MFEHRSFSDFVDELYFSDEATDIFYPIRAPRRITDPRLLGVYQQRLAAANIKVRFAARAAKNIERLIRELEHGEFIYFDDANRLDATFNLEAFVIFLRATIDTTTCAYAIYFCGKSDVDSINDVLKKWPVAWVPAPNRGPWERIHGDYKSATFSWIHSIVGRDKGMSWRDLAVHKSSLDLDTLIDDFDRGRFVIFQAKQEPLPALACIADIFSSAIQFINELKQQVANAECGNGE